jgi:Phage integrase family
VCRHGGDGGLDRTAMADATAVLRAMGHITKSAQRDRRPTLHELDRLMTHFASVIANRPDSAPMQAITAFAIFSTRRQDEITMWCDLPPEAPKIIQAQLKSSEFIFPYKSSAVCSAFHRATFTLGISSHDMPEENRLHFPDLRHEGISRLFEIGWNIPQVAVVSGHRSWTSLKRYTHIKIRGDKYENWKWLEISS